MGGLRLRFKTTPAGWAGRAIFRILGFFLQIMGNLSPPRSPVWWGPGRWETRCWVLGQVGAVFEAFCQGEEAFVGFVFTDGDADAFAGEGADGEGVSFGEGGEGLGVFAQG